MYVCMLVKPWKESLCLSNWIHPESVSHFGYCHHQLLTPMWKERRSLRKKSCLSSTSRCGIMVKQFEIEELQKRKFLHKKIAPGRILEMFKWFYSPFSPFNEVPMMACHKIAQKLNSPIVFWVSANTQHQFKTPSFNVRLFLHGSQETFWNKDVIENA